MTVVEEFKDKRIPNDPDTGRNHDLEVALGKKGYTQMVEQYENYRAQLFTYLSSYTSGDLCTRVIVLKKTMSLTYIGTSYTRGAIATTSV